MVPAFVGMSIKILSTDQSSKISGWAVLDDGWPVKYGRVDLTGELNVPERVKHMFLDLVKIIDAADCNSMAVEAVQFQRNLDAYALLANIQGALICYAHLRGIPVSSPLPTEWRKTLGFRQGSKVKREELKAQAIQYVKENFGLDVSEDEAEAICIGRAEYLRLKS